MTVPAHVYWIGGGSGAGKSTISRRLAAGHGLRRYSTDRAMTAHADRLDADEAPQLAAFRAMDMDERWCRRSPEVMLETFHWFRGEGFRLIVEDLRATTEPVVAEGFRLLPHLVAPLAAPGHAVWLLPTPEFRRAAFDSRTPPGRSRTAAATRHARCTTCWSGTDCSPNGWRPRPPG